MFVKMFTFQTSFCSKNQLPKAMKIHFQNLQRRRRISINKIEISIIRSQNSIRKNSIQERHAGISCDSISRNREISSQPVEILSGSVESRDAIS